MRCLLMLVIAFGTAPSASARPPDPSGAILVEMNRLRRDPVAYADKLVALRRHFEGRLLKVPGKTAVLTQEGRPAVDEAIAVLRQTKPLPTLAWSQVLARAASAHATDLGRTGALGHVGSDGSTPETRVDRFGVWDQVVAENIAFGSMTAAEVVIDLIVDDGVADRGHRGVMLSSSLRWAGVACQPHPSYRMSCVIDYAAIVGTETPVRRRSPRRVW